MFGAQLGVIETLHCVAAKCTLVKLKMVVHILEPLGAMKP